MIHIEGEKKRGKGGRKAISVVYTDVDYNGKEYTIGTMVHKSEPLKFVIDKEDSEKVKSRHWYATTTGKYVGTHVTVCGKKKLLMLHNVIMDRLTFDGKGAKETVDHINRNGLDNRKENLRVVSQTEQNLNQSTKKRKCTLPEDCGLTPADIPKHIWYIKPNGLHGDRFGIDLKTEGIKWKTSSSKLLPLSEKLKEAKEKLEELYETYPYLKPTEVDDSDYCKIIELSS